MLELLVVFAACVVVALISVHDERAGLAIAFAGFILIPFVAGTIQLSGFPSLHVATILILTLATARVLLPSRRPPVIATSPTVPLTFHLLILAFIAGATLTQLAGDQWSYSFGFLTNQVVAPYIFFLLCCDTSRRYGSFYKASIYAFLSAGFFQSALAILVASGFVPQPYENSFSDTFWWRIMVENGRGLGTMDHPLNLGLLLAACVPLLVYIDRVAPRMAGLMLLMVGIGVSQSRIAVVGALAGVIYLAVLGFREFRSKLALAFALAGGYWLLTITGFAALILSRFADDSGSSSGRTLAWSYLLPEWEKFAIHGIGIQNSKAYMERFGLLSSAESAILSYSIAFGILLTFCFFGAVAVLLVSARLSHRKTSAGIFSALVVVGSIQFYSSIATTGTAALILWTTLYFAIGGTSHQTEHDEEDRSDFKLARNPEFESEVARLR